MAWCNSFPCKVAAFIWLVSLLPIIFPVVLIILPPLCFIYACRCFHRIALGVVNSSGVSRRTEDEGRPLRLNKLHIALFLWKILSWKDTLEKPTESCEKKECPLNQREGLGTPPVQDEMVLHPRDDSADINHDQHGTHVSEDLEPRPVGVFSCFQDVFSHLMHCVIPKHSRSHSKRRKSEEE